MKIWLDDERDPKIYGQGFHAPTIAIDVLEKHGRDGWVWVKTVDEVLTLLKAADNTKQQIEVLSCDNDLGNTAEGHTALNWLEEVVFGNPDFLIPQYIYFHSANDARRDGAEQAINNIYRFKVNRRGTK